MDRVAQVPEVPVAQEGTQVLHHHTTTTTGSPHLMGFVVTRNPEEEDGTVEMIVFISNNQSVFQPGRCTWKQRK